MSLIHLTELDNGNVKPLSVNPSHVVSIRPRRTIVPKDDSQDPRAEIAFEGTILKLVTGDQHWVSEELSKVQELIDPAPIYHEMVSSGRGEISPPPPGAAQTNEPPPEVAKKATAKKPTPAPTPPVTDSAEDTGALVPD